MRYIIRIITFASVLVFWVVQSSFAQSEQNIWHGSFGADKKCILMTISDQSYSYEFGDCGGSYVAPIIDTHDQAAMNQPVASRNGKSEIMIMTHEDKKYTFQFDANQTGNKLNGDWSGPTGNWQGAMYKKKCKDASLCID